MGLLRQPGPGSHRSRSDHQALVITAVAHSRNGGSLNKQNHNFTSHYGQIIVIRQTFILGEKISSFVVITAVAHSRNGGSLNKQNHTLSECWAVSAFWHRSRIQEYIVDPISPSSLCVCNSSTFLDSRSLM